MYYSRPFQDMAPRSSQYSNGTSHLGRSTSSSQNAPTTTTAATVAGGEDESISGMLSNFSKALGLGPPGQSPRPSPTMEGYNRQQQPQQQQPQQQFRNQQPGYAGGQQGYGGQQQQMTNQQQMRNQQQNYQQQNYQQPNYQQQNMQQQQNMMNQQKYQQQQQFQQQQQQQQQARTQRANYYGGQYGGYSQQRYSNQRYNMQQTIPAQQPYQQLPQQQMQQLPQQQMQQLPQQQMQQLPQQQPVVQQLQQPTVVQQPAIVQQIPQQQYIMGQPIQQQPAVVGQPQTVVGQPIVGQPQVISAAPNYMYTTSQNSFLQQPPPPAGTVVQPQQPQIVTLQQQPAPTTTLIQTSQPGVVVQTQQPPVQIVPASQQQQYVQGVVVQTSEGQVISATPAPILACPTPAPIVVNASGAPPAQPAGYSFDPAGLTPAQQQAYLQAQTQHQQQHLKKMRQRLPHGQKTGSPHVGRKLDCSMVVSSGSGLPAGALLSGATLVGTPDTLSESGSIKSGRSRSRTLPFLPPEEPAPLPSQAKKAQDRINSHRRAFANFRQSSLDALTSRGYGGLSRPRPSNSETNLRKLTLEDNRMARPGSALGLLQASTVVSSHGPSMATKEHEKRILENILPPDLRHLIRGGPSSQGSIQAIRQQIESDLRSGGENKNVSEAQIARLNAEKRLLGVQSERIRAEMLRYASMKDPHRRAEMKHKLNPVLDAQLNRNRKTRGHRRNFSDGRISTSLTDNIGDEFGYVSERTRPYSSLSGGYMDQLVDPLGMDNSQSYLGGHASTEGGGVLRDTAIGSGLEDDDRNRYLASRSRHLLRRSSDGGIDPTGSSSHQGRNFDPNSSPLATRRPHSSMSGKMGTRSWHPTPFASDDESEEHQFFKEEKKNRIKMEISRRRQQIEENARLHEELIRLAKLRESAELGIEHRLGVPGYPSPTVSPGAGTSVLRSVDEILRTDHGYAGHHHRTNPGRREYNSYSRYNCAEEDHSLDRLANSFNTDRYTDSLYNRVADFSPVNSDFSTEFPPHAMPLLPDMPSRSRKLLEDLGTSSYTGGKYSTGRSLYR